MVVFADFTFIAANTPFASGNMLVEFRGGDNKPIYASCRPEFIDRINNLNAGDCVKLELEISGYTSKSGFKTNGVSLVKLYL